MDLMGALTEWVREYFNGAHKSGLDTMPDYTKDFKLISFRFCPFPILFYHFFNLLGGGGCSKHSLQFTERLKGNQRSITAKLSHIKWAFEARIQSKKFNVALAAHTWGFSLSCCFGLSVLST